ncbi:MAG: hypothetical protein LBI89_03950 [Prevotellaceae bacterium]|jgi:hypothetical protein|nr:hypothetical protein [Prevotellaceae bacterium]
MSLLLNTPPAKPAIERVTTEQTDALFNFRPGTVDDLAAELREPKQPFAIPCAGDMPGTGSPPPEPTPADQRREAAMAATQIIDMTDGAMSFALSFIGKRDAGHYRLDAGSKNMIRPHLAEYLKGKAVDIPPGFLLLFILIMVYSPVIRRAVADRREAKEAKKAAAPGREPAPVPPATPGDDKTTDNPEEPWQPTAPAS